MSSAGNFFKQFGFKLFDTLKLFDIPEFFLKKLILTKSADEKKAGKKFQGGKELIVKKRH